MHSNRLPFLFYVCDPGEDLLQVRGQNSLLHSSMDPLPEVSGKQEVADTADHTLETFYPISPIIDMQKAHVYREMNLTGEETPSPVPCYRKHALIVLCSSQVFLRLSTAQGV